MLDMQNVKDIEITEGNVRTIHDKDDRLIWGRLAYDTKYAGDTEQDGTPTPDAPVAIQVVTGEQTVTISDGVSSKDFTISLGSLELCKIGDYQDKIFNNDPSEDWYDPDLEDNAWYVHKEVGKYIFDGSESWTAGIYGTNSWILANVIMTQYDTAKTQILSTKFRGVANNNRSTSGDNVIYTASNYQVWIRETSLTSLAAVQTATSGTPTYYRLATATDTQITDTTLISQLDAIHEWLTRYGYSSTVTGNLPLIINQTNL